MNSIPWKLLTLFFGLCTVAGLVIILFFPNFNSPKREFHIVANPARSVIIDKNNIQDAPFKIIKQNGEEIKDNVSSVLIHFWNAGRKEISKSDILEPIKIIINDSSAEILRTDSIQYSRNICNIQLLKPTIADSLPAFQIYFDLLENMDGGTLQLLYIGDPNAQISFSGLIKGKTDLSHSKVIQNNFFNSDKFDFLILGIIIFLTAPVFLLVTKEKFYSKFTNVNEDKMKKRRFYLRTYMIFLLIITIALMFKIIIFPTYKNEPNIPKIIYKIES